MICEKCGAEIKAEGKFCTNCGAPNIGAAIVEGSVLEPAAESLEESEPLKQPETAPDASTANPQLEPAPLQPELPQPEPTVELPAETEVQSGKPEPEAAEIPAEAPATEPPVETPTAEPQVDTPTAEPTVETPPQTAEMQPLPELPVDTPATEPPVETPTAEPQVDTPTAEPTVETPPQTAEMQPQAAPYQEQFAPPASMYMPDPNMQAAPNPAFGQAPQQPSKPKKSKKGLWITLIIVAVLIVAAVAAFFIYQGYLKTSYDAATELFNAEDYQGAKDGFAALGTYEDSDEMETLSQQWLDYQAAQALLDDADFAGALTGFEALGDFEDAADKAVECQNNIDFIAAQDLFNNGQFDEALTVFEQLRRDGFKEAAEWVSKTMYSQANKLQTDGDLYGAYNGFKDLGTYEDSADRAAACTTPFPANGTLTFDQAYASSNAELVVDGGAAFHDSYFKLYSGTTLVATFWVSAGNSVTIGLAPGTYSLKQASGSAWFGETVMFGDEGQYVVVEIDGGAEFTLEYNIQMTLTFSTFGSSGGNVGSTPTKRDGF